LPQLQHQLSTRSSSSLGWLGRRCDKSRRHELTPLYHGARPATFWPRRRFAFWIGRGTGSTSFFIAASEPPLLLLRRSVVD
jgi:hypothetical protein